MPHLIIESSLPLSSRVVEDLHCVVGEQESVSIEAVKTRFYSPLFAFSGRSGDEPHTAITLKLLSGRSLQLKDQMATNIFNRAIGLIKEGTVSVEVIDLGVYKK